jgi:lysozyme
VSRIGLHLIAESEGFKPTLYNDPANHCTIGFGHLVHKGPCNGSDPAEREFLNGITRPRAEELLRQDVRTFERAVSRLVTVPLTQGQFDALVDFAYNLGAATLERSTLLAKLNAGDYAAVPAELRRYTKAGGQVQPGLVRRREREAHLFSMGLK